MKAGHPQCNKNYNIFYTISLRFRVKRNTINLAKGYSDTQNKHYYIHLPDQL